MEDFSKRLKLAEDVLFREVGDEAVLLNLNTQKYYSLNLTGMCMLQALKQSASIEQALTSLLDEYAVDPAVLRGDLQELIDNLLKQGLVEII
jgi:hypothetical protein